MIDKMLYRVLLLALLSVGLSSCSTGTPELAGLSPQAQAEIIKNYGGVYKVGNPYQIAGKWYYPKEDYSYSEVGVASWYGEDFNGKQTANGERYNMNTLTAAHRTLPLPCIVKVTNLQNGRSIVLRVNDRGPYVKDRIIDLSKHGAQLLGYMGQGTTKVKVEIMEKESKALKAALLNMPVQEETQTAEYTPAPSLYESSAERISVSEKTAEQSAVYASAGGKQYAYGSYDASSGSNYEQVVYGSAAASTGGVRTGSMGTKDGAVYTKTENAGVKSAVAKTSSGYQYQSGYYYVHAGAFSEQSRAENLLSEIKKYGSGHVVKVSVNGSTLYRVSFGPYSRVEEATVAQAKLKYYGIKDARIEKK
jgi:rare lipoprotein A